VTKAAQVGIQMELTKHWDEIVSQFRACSVLSIVLNSFTGSLLVLYWDLLKLQSLYRLVLITALHGQTIQDLLLALDEIYLHLLF
jgi:hypothetical protein